MIKQSYHKMGLGKVLLEQRISKIISIGKINKVEVNTSQYTEGFYKKYGFTTEKIVKDAYGPGINLCYMRLDLPGKNS